MPYEYDENDNIIIPRDPDPEPDPDPSEGYGIFLDNIDYKIGTLSVLIRNAEGDHREALVPGNFDRAKLILPKDLYRQVVELWTPEVIERYESIKGPEDLEPPEPPPPSRIDILEARLELLENEIITLQDDNVDLKRKVDDLIRSSKN